MKINLFKRFVKDESGASMVEYAVALLVVTGIGVGVMSQLGTEVDANAKAACGTLQDSADGSCTVAGN